ncbi:hypothetical protein FVEN_g12079 [Fusarium venenatum]|uniref:NmrA-like domain-containing protein n=1 Tax=Fusarium venenatum TaxID=56646 RepID=A0A2L2SYZ5_9HYPO|nr:uncharacterized protein FVRRES_06724 [Fusarium venenatum]KAG8349711.1 hypothetical protein FVEN_g12079 [Fusarium venenatum]KAH6993699.1 hypothetical protein EDB82DRAFT_499724 [Fusarium venenatum]CEI62288.1 unnamed protein product [Fusarium venenatum]
MSSIVFVTGATGRQGSAVARQLLDIGWTVRATARNMESLNAKELQSMGAKVIPGDWENEKTIKEAIDGCTHVFLNVVPNLATFTSEVPHAKRILDMAKHTGVKHVIYSSGMAIKDLEKGQYHDPNHPVCRGHGWKRDIENLVQEAGFDAWTILRPGFFMCNLLEPKVNMMYPDLIRTGILRTAYTPETRLPHVDVEDIAKFAVAAFREPERFNRQFVPIASEKLSLVEITRQLGEATGRDLRTSFLANKEIEEKMATDFFVAIQVMARDLENKVDIDDVQRWGIPLTSFAEFLKREESWVKSIYT